MAVEHSQLDFNKGHFRSDELSQTHKREVHEKMSPGQNQDRLAGFIQTHKNKNGETLSFSLRFVVPNLNCANCMRKIETHFAKFKNLTSHRVNLSLKQVVFQWDAINGQSPFQADELNEELQSLGFESRPLMEAVDRDAHQAELKSLLWCLAVAGFATGNVMLLSVSIWSGAEGATRDFFHWLSALIALPTVAFAGRPFYVSAFRALKARHLNMDVPISLAVILAACLSLFETINHGEHAFFDASVSLLFFLLIGRTLDRMMRARAYQGVQQLLALKTETATVVLDDGTQDCKPISDLSVGQKILVRAGETIPVDGKVISGTSDIDWSLVSGESLPQAAGQGTQVYSGLINLSGPLTIEVTAMGEQTLLAEIVRYMEAAQSSAPKYRQLADRAATLYAPLVHFAAGLTFLVWLIYGVSWQMALYTAISVLIITCPCALGLAVPVVQVVASSIAQRRGVLMKDGAALEKLSEINTVIFDKTGTLTLAVPEIVSQRVELHSPSLNKQDFIDAFRALAGQSSHPLSKALHHSTKRLATELKAFSKIEEHAGQGLITNWRGGILRLGSLDWCGLDQDGDFEIAGDVDLGDLSLWGTFTDQSGVTSYAYFGFVDQVRPGVQEVIHFFNTQGIEIHLLSGDRPLAVKRLAKLLGIHHWRAALKPQEKAAIVSELGLEGRKVLMVGDGLNDGPSLQAAYVSLSPSIASDVAQVSASFVLMKDCFQPIIELYNLALNSRRLIWQNFMLAALYNMIAIPVAVLGGATPIVAAIAMSVSSLVVMANALRLHYLMGVRKSKNRSFDLVHPHHNFASELSP